MMYYELYWQTQDGRVDSRKLSTTEEKARQWVTQKNTKYPGLKHWYELLQFTNTQQIGDQR